jgi:adenylyltransferase/sulfurtransferase
MDLNEAEKIRYNRQLILPELGLAGQKKLKDAKVLMIGAGGLGCPVLQYLAAAGVGQIGIIDHDVVDESNLHRQILYNHLNIGKNKALIAQEKLSLLNPLVKTNVYPFKLNDENASEIIQKYDLVIDGSDNFKTRYLVNDVCVSLKKPWVFGSIFKFEGQVAIFHPERANTYRDVYPEAPDENTVPNCAEIGVLGVLPGLIGLIMANEAIKFICDIGETLLGKLLVYDTLENDFKVYKLTRPKQQIAEKNLKTDKNVATEVAFDDLEKLGKYYLLDVREEWEFEDFNKGGTNIPLNLLPQKLQLLASEDTIVCCCNYGNKSKIAVKLIKDQYPDKEVYSVKNGIEEC